MESTKLLKAIAELRKQYDTPVSHLDIVRDSVLKQVANATKVEMPAILDDSQRKVFMGKIDLLEGFLESPNGADAVELLVDAFENYCDKVENEAPETEDDDEGM